MRRSFRCLRVLWRRHPILLVRGALILLLLVHAALLLK